MAHLQYMPGDPRLVDQLVYELKSKGIFDQFRKDCIADVDTRPAYQNLRQRVESSVSTFLSRQCWQPDLNKNQLREKLRKHILDGNYLEQGVERIVDQVVNPKVASVFIPQVEDLVYNYLGVTRKKTVNTNETKNDIIKDLLPTDLEAVSPGSVKSNDDNDEKMEMDAPVPNETKMEVDQDQNPKVELKNEDTSVPDTIDKVKEKSEPVTEKLVEKETNDVCENSKNSIPMPADDCKVENIPPPEDSLPRVQLEKIDLPKVFPDIPLPDSIIMSADIPLPDEIKDAKDEYFKPINSDEDESSSDSSLRRNMSPLTPIRNFNNENSCDAQQAFDNDTGDTEGKNNDKKELNTFRFAIDAKTTENNKESIKTDKKEIEQTNLAYQFNNQVNINNFNTPLYEDSSNSNNLQIDYESDANSKAVLDVKVNEESVTMEEVKKDRKAEDKKSSHKSSHRSRDTSKHSSSKEKRSDSKPSNSRDTSRHDKKSSRDDHSKSKSSHKDKSSDKIDKKDSDKKERDSSRHRSSHKSSSHKDSKSHKSSSTSSSQRRSSKYSDDKKSSSSSNNKEKSEKYSERSSEKSSKDRLSKDSKSSSNRSDKDRKSSSSKSSSKHDEKDKDKKSKKETDDHYSVSGRGNSTRRSTDRDSNDGSSSSKGSHNPASLKSSSISQKDSKGSSSKSENTSPSGDSTSPSDKEQMPKETKKSNTNNVQPKPIVRVDTRLELPMASPPRLPFVPDVTLKKPKFAANLEEAKKLMRMRRFLDEEQKRMNQEAALLLEFQANVRPSLSQVYSSIPGPELEFACVSNNDEAQVLQNNPAISEVPVQCEDNIRILNPTNALLAVVNAQNMDDITGIENELSNITGSNNSKKNAESINETEAQLPKVSKKLETTHESEQVTVQIEEDCAQINNVAEARVPDVGNEIDEIKETILVLDDSIGKPDSKNEAKNKFSVQKTDSVPEKIVEDEDDDRTEYFEITVIAEELSESEETPNNMDELKTVTNIDSEVNRIEEPRLDNNNTPTIKAIKEVVKTRSHPEEEDFRYFTSDEQSQAVVSRDRFSGFLQSLTEKHVSNKVYLINCDTYEESVVKGVLESLGTFEVVNYHRNGHLKIPKTSKSIIKNVNVASEVSLPFDNNEFEMAASELEMDLKVTRQTVLSPVKSECSFELSSDYDAKLTEMVNNTSRQEIMEIILGNAMCNESPSKMPTIDYVHDCNIDSEAIVNLRRKIGETESESTSVSNSKRKRSAVESKTAVNSKSKKDDIETEKVTNFERHVSEIESESEAVKNLKRKISEIEAEDETLDNLKRKINEIEPSVNNNRPVLTPKKLRKMSASDQITSTTQESESPAADTLNTRSKYLGRARRVGLSRPRKTEHPNSPSSDMSVENYSQNATQGGAPVAPNGKLPARNKIQRYDTSDLYKPKLHYLSRRNNIS